MTVERRRCKQCMLNRQTKFFKPRGVTCRRCLAKNRKKQVRDLRILKTYELSREDTQALSDYQGGLCAICRGRRSTLDTDHDHALEKQGVPPRECVRGLLCARCNRQLLRTVRDDPTLLRAAADYLENPPWDIVRKQLDA